MNEQNQPPAFLAAIDLGSNSFHMVVARIEDGHIHILDKLKEMVRLGAGLDEQRVPPGPHPHQMPILVGGVLVLAVLVDIIYRRRTGDA